MNNKSKTLYRKDFFCFVWKALKELEGITVKDQLYVALMCQFLEPVLTGDRTRAILNAPPRHLKTLVGGVCLAAYQLGLNPREQVMLVAYSPDLARDITDKIREIVRSDWYQQVFPGTRIKKYHDRSGDFETTAGGRVQALSIDSRHAGRGATLIIVDDMIDLHDWNNEEVKAAAFQKLNGMVLSRFNTPKEGRVVFIAHRLHEDDTTAALLATGEYDHLPLPYMATRLQSFDLGFTTYTRKPGDLLRPDAWDPKAAANLRHTVIEPPYEYLYQQGTEGADAVIITKKHFRRYADDAALSKCRYVISVDTALKGGEQNSHNVIQVWATDGKNHWLCEQWRERCKYKRLKKAFNQLVGQYKPSAILIEDTANGGRLIDDAKDKGNLNVVPVVPKKGRSKSQRLRDASDVILRRRIYLPKDADWVASYIEEFLNFPRLGSDQVDATTQFIEFMKTNPSLAVPADKGFQGAIASGSQRDQNGWHSSGARRRVSSDGRVISEVRGAVLLTGGTRGPAASSFREVAPGQSSASTPSDLLLFSGPGARRFIPR